LRPAPNYNFTSQKHRDHRGIKTKNNLLQSRKDRKKRENKNTKFKKKKKLILN